MPDATFATLGIRIGTTWQSPLAAVRDANGHVTWQAQDVRDWDAVIAAARAATRSALPARSGAPALP